MSRLLDLTGKKFGRLKVTGRASNHKFKTASRVRWFCQCQCGVLRIIDSQRLREGDTKSCGCLKRDTMARVMKAYHTTHGGSYTKLYNAWRGLLKRCYNSTDKNYHRYGARGIKVCPSWRYSFENFRSDMGESHGRILDRINNDGNYEATNCRWTDAKTSSRNRRTARFLTMDGERKTASEWSEITGMNKATMFSRIRAGWTDSDVLTVPVGKSKETRC